MHYPSQDNLLILKPQKPKFIGNSTLILLALSTAFFPRLLDALGAPSTINFVHFFTVPFCLMVALATTPTKNNRQLALISQIFYSLLILLTVMLISALLNQVGAINVILHFLMLGEPFLLLMAIISIPMTVASIQRFRKWISRFAFSNLILALIMCPLAYANILPNGGMSAGDSIQGVFYFSGAGNTISTSVSLSFGVYYLVNAKKVPFWLRVSVLMAGFIQLMVSDSKQVVFPILLSGILLTLINFDDLGKAISYIIGFGLLLFVFFWCVENVDAFFAFKGWMSRSELYGPDGEVTLTKTAAFRIVPNYYESFLHWLFGLGSGHTAGRLGGWMLRDYASLLTPLGSTIHPASQKLWTVVFQATVARGSTMFSPFFGWAGIWGDLGIVGLGAYFYLASVVWRQVCSNNMTRFLLLTVFSFGLIFTQMEEPGYMLFIATLIGLQWQENQIKNQARVNRIVGHY